MNEAAVTPDYWTAAATVMPLLTATIVIESKVLLEKWGNNVPSSIKGLQLIFWALILGVFSFAETVCFRALRGEKIDESWFQWIENAISGAVGLAILLPALTLFSKALKEFYVGTRTYPTRRRNKRMIKQKRMELREVKQDYQVAEKYSEYLRSHATEQFHEKQLEAIRQIAAARKCGNKEELDTAFDRYELLWKSWRDLHDEYLQIQKKAFNSERKSIPTSEAGDPSSDFRQFDPDFAQAGRSTHV